MKLTKVQLPELTYYNIFERGDKTRYKEACSADAYKNLASNEPIKDGETKSYSIACFEVPLNSYAENTNGLEYFVNIHNKTVSVPRRMITDDVLSDEGIEYINKL